MRSMKRFYFTAALCLSALVFSCDIPAAGSEPIPWVFFVTLSIRNETASSADISLYAETGGWSSGNDIIWGVYRDEGVGQYQTVDRATLLPGMSGKMFANRACYTHSNQKGIGLASFLLKIGEDKYYAGWDVSKYGNMVYFDDVGSAELSLAGSGYGYVIGENPEAAGQWHSTLSPYTKTLNEFRQISATYNVRITDSGAVFDSVELIEHSSRLPLDESEEYHP